MGVINMTLTRITVIALWLSGSLVAGAEPDQERTRELAQIERLTTAFSGVPADTIKYLGGCFDKMSGPPGTQLGGYDIQEAGLSLHCFVVTLANCRPHAGNCGSPLPAGYERCDEKYLHGEARGRVSHSSLRKQGFAIENGELKDALTGLPVYSEAVRQAVLDSKTRLEAKENRIEALKSIRKQVTDWGTEARKEAATSVNWEQDPKNPNVYRLKPLKSWSRLRELTARIDAIEREIEAAEKALPDAPQAP